MVTSLSLSAVLIVFAAVIGPTNTDLAEQANAEFEQAVSDLKASDARIRGLLRKLTTATGRSNATAQTWGMAETVATDAGSGLLKALGIGGGVAGTGVATFAAWKFLRRKREDEESDGTPSTTVNVTGVQVQRPVKADMQTQTS